MIIFKILIRLLCWPFYLGGIIAGSLTYLAKWAYNAKWSESEKELFEEFLRGLMLKGAKQWKN